MNLENLKQICFLRLFVVYYRYWRSKRSYCRGKNNTINKDGVMAHSKLQIVGNDNNVIIEKNAILVNTKIYLSGNNNSLIIHKGAYLEGADICLEDDNLLLEIGRNTFVGPSHLAVTENGSQLIIGDDCMISSHVQIRTGDSHAILDLQGNRLNPAKPINIGNHCWLGEGCKIMKGVCLQHDTVVSTGSIVTKSFTSNTLLGGVPSKVLKDNITWNKSRY